jgi:hypothetical protein
MWCEIVVECPLLIALITPSDTQADDGFEVV